ncbi:hypothetical protein KR51_00003820 [Rubidibacter lacunae KORDI 51-2]|uniref:Uncharacterized protein n=1 Tax=Rubidibacter lacunae KORDI 51-2 TaxID=582515 RepID=U5DPR3_9CHRO|nr:hypothetical protein KR51_00003820 [Rubidibacter lacunae KORDI 51-2]
MVTLRGIVHLTACFRKLALFFGGLFFGGMSRDVDYPAAFIPVKSLCTSSKFGCSSPLAICIPLL